MAENYIQEVSDERLLAFDEVKARVGALSRVTIWRMTAAGTFPPPIRLGRRVVWRERDISGWVAARR